MRACTWCWMALAALDHAKASPCLHLRLWLRRQLRLHLPSLPLCLRLRLRLRLLLSVDLGNEATVWRILPIVPPCACLRLRLRL